jgi:hypothetical protein
VHAFKLVVVERCVQRELCFSSDSRRMLDRLPRRKQDIAQDEQVDSNDDSTQGADATSKMADEVVRERYAAAGQRYARGDLLANVVDGGGQTRVCGPSISMARTRSPSRVAVEKESSGAFDAAAVPVPPHGGGSTAGHTTGSRGGFRPGELLRAPWTQWETEQLVHKSCLKGLLPTALLEQYVFWRCGPRIVRGYSTRASIGSQLLVKLWPSPDDDSFGLLDSAEAAAVAEASSAAASSSTASSGRERERTREVGGGARGGGGGSESRRARRKAAVQGVHMAVTRYSFAVVQGRHHHHHPLLL